MTTNQHFDLSQPAITIARKIDRLPPGAVVTVTIEVSEQGEVKSADFRIQDAARLWHWETNMTKEVR